LGLEGLQKPSEDKLDSKAIEVCVIKVKEKFKRIPEEEVQRYLERLSD
jgi:20S proteasome alpha/beta subunit